MRGIHHCSEPHLRADVQSCSSTWTNVANMLEPRQAPAHGASGATDARNVAGGVAGPANDIPTNTVEQFNPLTGVCRPRRHCQLPTPAVGSLLHRAGGSISQEAAHRQGRLRRRSPSIRGPRLGHGVGTATGFEQGALTGWATARNLRVMAGEAYTGSYGAQLSSTGPGGAYARLTLPALDDRVFARAWFRPTTQGASAVTLLQLRTLLGAMISVQRLPSGQLSLFNELTVGASQAARRSLSARGTGLSSAPHSRG